MKTKISSKSQIGEKLEHGIKWTVINYRHTVKTKKVTKNLTFH